VSVYTLNKLLIFSQAAHLSYLEGGSLSENEANIARARHVREAFETEAGTSG
jgi:protein-arginine kinase